MKKIVILSIIMIYSCGLPDYGALEDPKINISPDNSVITITLVNNINLKGFEIYARYYLEGDSLEFSRSDYIDSGLNQKKFLSDKKFVLIETESISDSLTYKLEFIPYYSGIDQRVKLNEIELTFPLNNVRKLIGSFEDQDFNKLFINKDRPVDNNIEIEFAILANGVNINQGFGVISSFPVYLGNFKLQLK